MCDLFFFPLNFFFFFLRLCLSGCVHGVHVNRKVVAVPLFQRHSKHTGKRKDKGGDVDEGRKRSVGWKDHPLFFVSSSSISFFFLFPTLLSYTLSNYLNLFFPPLQFPLPFSQSKLVPKARALRLRMYPPQSSFRGLFVPRNNFLWQNPNHTIVRSIREFMFWVSCRLFGFSLFLPEHIYLYSYFFCQRLQ